MNLCTNASHAMDEEGGVLEVRLRNAEFGVRSLELRENDIHSASRPDTGSYVRLSVSDTGCGMDKGVMERIFDPYFTTKPSGTGLGLAIVKKIIDEHGGTIWAKNMKNNGSCFTIQLPVKINRPDEQQSTAEA